MLTRRLVLAAPLAALPFSASAEARFADFLAGVRMEARRAGVSEAVLDEALEGVQPSAKVLELDHHQPEFTMTWAQYKAKVLPQSRLDEGHAHYRQEGALLARVTRAYPADPRIVTAIWGLESAYGVITGKYRVVEALATLGFDGRRASYFRAELITSLRILQNGDISAHGMTGSWAGAMGQPQFMPSAFVHYAVDADGDGRRDIWNSKPDVFGSVANYLARSGWRMGEPWGQAVRVPENFAAGSGGRNLGEWTALGVRRADGRPFSRSDVLGTIVMPDGPGGEAYMTYANFRAIKRYNNSDYYALAVGLLGNAVG